MFYFLFPPIIFPCCAWVGSGVGSPMGDQYPSPSTRFKAHVPGYRASPLESLSCGVEECRCLRDSEASRIANTPPTRGVGHCGLPGIFDATVCPPLRMSPLCISCSILTT